MDKIHPLATSSRFHHDIIEMGVAWRANAWVVLQPNGRSNPIHLSPRSAKRLTCFSLIEIWTF
jgi:hypothetical protein